MRPTIPLISISITSTCNLNCNGCQIGSNFDYKEHMSWKEQKPIMEKWAQKVDITAFEIFGGEPLLNPEWYEWFTGISELWPNAIGWITSNGYAISAKKNQKLYDFLKQSNGRHWLDVSHHNDTKLEWLISNIHKFLNDNVVESRLSTKDGWLRRGTIYEDFDEISDEPMTMFYLKLGYNDVKDPNWPHVDSVEDWYNLPDWIKQECDTVHNVSLENSVEKMRYHTYVAEYSDNNGVSVIVRNSTQFSDGVLSIGDRSVAFHTSDAERAHNVCHNKICLEMYNGAIHQCSSVSHFKGWSEQLPMELTDQQQQLINNYKPLTAESTVEEITQFLNHDRWTPMPQCSLCPENRENHVIHATTKKIKFHK